MKKLIISLIFAIACSSSEPKLLSKDEYLDFADQMVKAIRNGNTKKLKNLLNLTSTYNELEDKIDSLGYSTRVPSAKWKSYRIELNNEFSIYLETLISLAKDRKVEASNYYEHNGRPHIIIAISSSNVSEFVDFRLVTIGDQTFIENYQSYNTGINFSQAFTWNALNKLEFGWMGGEYMDALDELKNAHVYLQRQQPGRAWIAINRIPDYFLYQSNFQTVRVRAASQLSDSLYANSLYDWIGNNWDQEGFRYLKAYEYYSYFGEVSEAKLYLDSLVTIAGQSSLTKELERRIN